MPFIESTNPIKEIQNKKDQKACRSQWNSCHCFLIGRIYDKIQILLQKQRDFKS